MHNLKFLYQLFAMSLLSFSLTAQIQINSIYDEKGSLKSIEQRRYEENQHKRDQGNVKPNETPSIKSEKPYTPSLSPEEEAKRNTKIRRDSKAQSEAYEQSLVLRYNISEISEGLIVAKQHNKYGFVDKSGNVALPLIYEEAYKFYEGQAQVKINGRWGTIDKSGKYIIHPAYEYSFYFSEGLSAAKVPYNLFGYINKNGEDILPAIYLVATHFKDGLAGVGFKEELPVGYNGNYAASKKQYKITYGYIDKFGTLVIPAKFDGCNPFSEGLAGVKNGKKWGYINKEGMRIIDGKYTSVNDFKNGIAKVIIDKFEGYINTKGEEVIPIEFDYVSESDNGIIKGKLNNVEYYFDSSGKQVGGEIIFVPKSP